MSQKVSISLDENILKLIDAERGDVPRSKFIESVLRSTGSFFEVMWIFSDEFDTLTRMERWGSTHTSQPIGKPLHKHEGFLSISENAIRFYDTDMNLLFSINKISIRDISRGYDDVFRRFRDSRGFIPPLKISLENKTLYLYSRTIGKKGIRGDRMFRGENESIELWFKKNV